MMNHLNHSEFLKTINCLISNLIKEDNILKDLRGDITSEELHDLVGLEEGKCWNIFIEREDDNVYQLIVDQNSTVSDLKKRFERHYLLLQKNESTKFISIKKKINWKYIWKTWHLSFNGQKLDDNKAFIKDYGIINKSKLKFVKYLNKK